MIPRSLNARMLVSVSVLLALFFGIAAGTLDYFFRDTSLRAIGDHLEAESLVLMAASEEDSGKLAPVREQLDVRFVTPNSGLYGEITTIDGNVLWRSPSLLGKRMNISAHVRPGQKHLGSYQLTNGIRVLVLSAGYSWEYADHQSQQLVFSVAESEEPYFKRLIDFRWRLFGGFAVMGALLIVSMLWLMRSVLQPLRKVETEIIMIEKGTQQLLSEDYPRELAGVANNMNLLLHHERERMTRYRNTLGNLAHSLKTPLAVIRNLVSDGAAVDTKRLNEQLTLMDNLVRYQLTRAAASGSASVGIAPVALTEVIVPVCDALKKVYFDKHVRCELNIEANCKLLCDKNDLMEIVGNLLDNAFKYGLKQVRVSTSMESERRVRIIVENDGKCIPIEQRQHVLQRGTRLDEQQSGQGIGLSVVSELVALYRGTVEIDQSTLGGARVTVRLPGV